MPIQKLLTRPASGDPIKFILQTNKQTVAPGEEVTLTLTAHYYSLSPALLFVDAGANAFRLKLLMPDGFVQTGGDYVDYIGTELSAAKPTITYTLKGYFETIIGRAEFRLLRGTYTADANSLFVEKARLTIGTKPTPVLAQTNGARTNGCAYAQGQYLFTTSWGEAVYAHYYNGILFAALQDGNGFKPRHWLVATGQMSAEDANCFAADDPHTSPPNNPTPNPGGGCSYSEGQYLFTFGSEVMYAHYYNGVLYAAYQNGSDFRPRHWLVATGQMSQANANCFAETDPRSGGTNPPGNPNPNPGGNCPYSEGQYLFTFNSEAIYAHYTNGLLFAAYQDRSNFKPQHWLTATGMMSSTNASCFAENDPGTGNTTNPPTSNPTSTCSVSRPRGVVDVVNGTDIYGWALDEADFNKAVTIELYVNGLKIATGLATEDRGDLVGAFGNNPAARYHGFHAKWSFNRTEDGTHTITAKICGADTPLRTEQVTFHYQTDPTGSAAPSGSNLPEVTVSAPSLYGAGPGTIWYPTFNSGAGSGPGGSNDGSNGGNDSHAGSGGQSGGGNSQISSNGNKGGGKPYSAQPTSTTNPNPLTDPHNGDSYIDSEGNIITYNAALGGWILPEVLISPYDKEGATVGTTIPWLFYANGTIGTAALTTAGWILVVATSLQGDTRPGQLLSKGGDRNIWPDQYGYPPRVQDVDWSKGDGQLADKIANEHGDNNRGPGTPHNLLKKWFRDKRPK